MMGELTTANQEFFLVVSFFFSFPFLLSPANTLPFPYLSVPEFNDQ